jgi:germination protein YpeB
MKPVWINLSNNVYTINYAYEQNGVIVYSDLIKVRVCAETNMVIGVEATSYWTNHTVRAVQNANLTTAQAKAKVWDEIEIESSRMAIVPIGQSTEKLCYEFSGELNGSTYYVYIDAVTGRQVEMFKVIESTEGQLLM